MRRTVHAMVLAVLLALPAFPAAASVMGVWEQLLPGQFLSVAVTPSPVPGEPDIILAGSPDSGGTLRSTDGGLSWTVAFPAPAWSLAVDPQSPATVYAATPSGLFRSDDHGTTWTNLNDFVKSWVLVDPSDSQTIYGDNRISTDAGMSWSVMSGLASFLPRTTEAPHVVASAGRPGTLFALNNNATWRSTDGGATWIHFGQVGKADTIAMDPVDGRWVYTGMCSDYDSARYYDDMLDRNLSLGSHTHAIVVDPSSPEKLYAVTSSGSRVWRSTNRGNSWTTYYDGLPQVSASEGRMVFDNADGVIYLPTLTEGLWRVATRGECTDADGDLFYGELNCGTAQDCDDDAPLVNPAALETCTDGIDNDCDGLADGLDSDCGGGTTPEPEICDDGIDNDGDGKTDCADKGDCRKDPSCN